MRLNAHIEELIIKHLQQTLTEVEQTELSKWRVDAPENNELFEKLTSREYISSQLEELYQYDEARGWETIKKIFQLNEKQDNRSGIIKMLNWQRATAAAVVFILLLGSYFLFFNKENRKNDFVKKETVNDVKAPETSKAILNLFSGQRVLLDSINKGQVAMQGDVNIIKTADGEIVYSGYSDVIQFNTLINPRGSKVQTIILSDGTKVWLNSESSIRFPVAFQGRERKVEITGEAYFEVTKDEKKRFIVSSNGITTEVLGTHFNVNTYTDESSAKVTLLEGSVRVAKSSATGLLKPGQQAQINEGIKITDNVDMDLVMAWKNGFFHFGKTSIQDLMKQISRWYDVEIVYGGQVPARQFGGEISREANLSQVVKILNEIKVKCRIEGKRMIIE
jgi:transmembrane sensor